MLTKRSGTLIEFKHDLHSGESCQGNKENLQSLVHSVRKLQSDVNSCLTKIIEEEKTSSATAMSKEISEDEDSDDSEEDLEHTKHVGDQNGGQPPQAKKLRR